MTTFEKNQNTLHRYFEEVWNQGKLEVLDELLSPDYINHNPGFSSPRPGPEPGAHRGHRRAECIRTASGSAS